MSSLEEQSPPETNKDELSKAKNVVFGAKQATSFICKVASGEKVEGVKYNFGADFVTQLHNRVVFGQTHNSGLRKGYGVWLGGIPLSNFAELDTKMYLYSSWLEGAADKIKQYPDDVVQALELSCIAHYEMVQRDFHPFYNGNGRTARGIGNSLLMLSTFELRAYHKAIPPVPIVRSGDDLEEKYIQALRSVDDLRILNPLMVYTARRWEENLRTTLELIEQEVKNPRRSSDQTLISNMRHRIEVLKHFIDQGEVGEEGVISFPVPDIFNPHAPRASTPFSKIS